LLLERRVNNKLGLEYEGQVEVDGEDFNVEAAEGRAPFKALLDVGLQRTTTGARVFGALKGATDGGLNVPHNHRRFPGTVKDGKDWKGNAEIHRKYIMGGHVSEYMTKLKEDDAESYARQFARYVKLGIKPDSLEAIYTKAHAAIRAEPFKKRDPLQKGRFGTRDKPKNPEAKYPKKNFKRAPITVKQRKARLHQKLSAVGLNVIYDRV